ncbi:MAG: hypothetical protein B1H11_11295 [Desulfobacteraceae bacterium 4484_190.1]|nr:MAG: hypothetical protein B1H11_11295 [Desulfobacteraceae bacterium 4484_190.1]
MFMVESKTIGNKWGDENRRVYRWNFNPIFFHIFYELRFQVSASGPASLRGVGSCLYEPEASP